MHLQPPWHHLVPFLLSVVASFIWFVPRPAATVGSMTLKCLPVVLLASYLFYLERWLHTEANFVLLALVLSAFGDAFLVFPKTLALPGVIAFGLAQLAYTYAFGFASINWVLGGVLYGIFVIIVVAILTTVKIPEKYRMAIPVPIIYALVIVTMLWRALDRYRLKEELSLARRLCTSVGGVIFVISDLSIIFLQAAQLIPQPYSKFVTISTYYLAQLLITLGATERFWTGDAAGTATTTRTVDLVSISTLSNPDGDFIQSSTDGELSSCILSHHPQETSDLRYSLSAEISSITSLPDPVHPSFSSPSSSPSFSPSSSSPQDASGDTAPTAGTGKMDALDSSPQDEAELKRTEATRLLLTGKER